MAQILIADTPNDSVSLKRILGGHDPVIVNTMKAAQAQLQEQSFDLIVVTLHFDSSHMFELIREIRRSSNNSRKPIICYCARDTKVARLMHECLQIVTRTLGAWMYLSEHEYNVIQNPDAELRRIIERCLTAESRKESLRRRMDLHRQRLEIHELRCLLIGQESSTEEVEEYSSELTHRLESVLSEVSDLQVSTETLRTSIRSSRDLKDRVSADVTRCEDNMTRLEEVQSLEEACQTTCESDLRQLT